MAIDPTTRNLGKYDFDHDNDIDHDDIAKFIMDAEVGDSSAIKTLLRFQKAGGELKIEDIMQLIDEGCPVKGSDILRFVMQGGKLTKDDITALKAKGVEFTDRQMTVILKKSGLTAEVSRFSEGTTPADLLEKFKSDKTITGADLAALRGPDGKPLATIDDFLKLKELGGTVKASDLLAFKSAGGTVTGPDLVKFVEKGMTMTAADLVAFAKGGTTFELKDLSYIIHTTKMPITKDDLLAINKDLTPAQVMVLSTSGPTTTVQDLLAAKGPDGKPAATMTDIIALMQKGGKVTPADIIAFQKAGGTVTGNDLAMLVNQGMKFTGADLVALAKGGVVIKEDELKHITNNSGISLTKQEFIDINPINLATGKPYIDKNSPVTIENFEATMTPEILAGMSKFGVKVTAQDLIAAYKASGQTLTLEGVKNFTANGGVVTGADLVEFQKAGVKFTGKDLAELQNNGVTFTAKDLIALSKGGTPIFEDELKHIVNNSKIPLSLSDFEAINPYLLSTKDKAIPDGVIKNTSFLFSAMECGVKVTFADFLALPGAGGQIHNSLGPQDLLKFVEKGGTVTGADLVAYQKLAHERGGKLISGDDLVALADKGVKFTADDIVELSDHGAVIWKDDLDYVLNKLDIKMTLEQMHHINPFVEGGGRLVLKG